MGGASGRPAEAEEMGHPLLQRRIKKTERSEVYLTTLSTAESWIVNEHRIMGHGLVPGTAYLEMVRAAAAGIAAGREIELRDVLFAQPVIVPDGQTRELYTALERRDDGVRFRVQSRGDGLGAAAWRDHATGSVLFHERLERPARPIGEVLEACRVTEVLDTEEQLTRRLKLDRVGEGGLIRFAFGPRWRCLTRIHSGSAGLLATLDLPEDYVSDLERCQLHPALMDVAGAAARIHAGEGWYLPFWYRSLRIARGLPRTVHCHLRLKESGDAAGETLTCDIDLLDAEGAVLAQVLDFTMKRINDVEALLKYVEQAAVAPARGADSGAAGEEPSVLAALRALSEGMSVEEGTEVFARLLAAKALPAQVVVSSKDLATMQRLAASIDPTKLASEVDRMAAPQSVHPRPELATPYVAPVTDVEKAIVTIWQEVLGIEGIGVEDDFFALGGHSLAAVQIGSKIRSHFGVELALRDFFDRPTVANTVRVVSEAGNGKAQAGADAIQRLSRDETEEVADGLEGLSDAEVDAKLREMLAGEAEQRGSKG
jgi:phthiocerol/phenolphthiocerol synthesis type-I polyketide synthase E